VEQVDIRDLTGWERFNKIASVGSVEHAHSYMGDYFEAIWHLLKRGGLFLNHGISSTFQYELPSASQSFVNQYVFPDGEVDPLSLTMEIAEKTGFEIRDVENLREHYAQTLRLWVENLERKQEGIRKVSGEITWRIFKLYMVGSARNFSLGRLNLFQTLLTKSDRGHTPLPATRKGWYA
jgi:cyclopropane-fatty-acyl-phospholipid synthase